MSTIEVQMQPNSTDDHGELDFEEEVEERDDVKMEGKNDGDNLDLSEDEKPKEDGEASELSDEGELPDSNSDGELNSDNEDEPIGINKDISNNSRPICKFFLRGSCTWGHTCRYMHSDRYGCRDNWHDWRLSGVNAPPMAEAPKTESAWERGMKQAKEMVKNASARKKQEPDFNEKKLNMKVEEALPVYDDHYYDQSPTDFNRIRYRSPPTPEPYAAPGQYEPPPPKTTRRGDEWHDPWVRGRSPKRRNRRASYSSYSSSSSSSASSSRSTSSSSGSSSSPGSPREKKANPAKPKRPREAPRGNRGPQINPRSRPDARGGGRVRESDEKRTISIAKGPINYQKEQPKRQPPPIQKNRRKRSSSSSSSSSSESSAEESPDRRNRMGKQNKPKTSLSDSKSLSKGNPTKSNVTPKPSIKMTLTSTKNVDRMNAVKRRSAIAARLNDDSDSDGEPPAKKSAVSSSNKSKPDNLDPKNKPVPSQAHRQRRESSPSKQKGKSPPKQGVNKMIQANDKKPSSRREELLKQLKKVEDAIKRKKSKMH